jgi:hypothetical protein
VRPPLLQAFPSARTLGEMVLHLPFLAGLFIYRSHGQCPFSALQCNPPHDTYKLSCSWLPGVCHHSCLLQPAYLFTVHMGCGPSPLSCGVFLPPPLLQTFLLLVAGRVPPLLLSLAALFIYSSMRDCLSPLLWHSGHPALFPTCLFVVVYYSFFSRFSLGGCRSVQGAMLIWPRVVCRIAACHLAHLVVCFTPASRSWQLAARELSWLLGLMWSGDAMRGLEVWRCWDFASSW